MSLLEEWKQNYHILEAYSEEIFGLKEQPENQCPTIDNIKDNVTSAYSEADEIYRHILWEEYDKAERRGDNVKHMLDGLGDELESLREEIIKIRAWGQDWKDFAKSLIDSGKIDINEYVTEYYRVEGWLETRITRIKK